MRFLITGGRGFIGREVVNQLRQQGFEAVTCGRHRKAPDSFQPNTNEHVFINRPDDPNEVQRLLNNVRPDFIIHLAGMVSAATLTELYQANSVFAANILEGMSKMTEPPTVVLTGSAAEYGPVPDTSLPVSEDFECRPNTPYGITKLAQTMHGLSAARAGLPVVIARVFNPIGPGMPTSLALGSFANQIAQLHFPGGVLHTGDLSGVRDFIDVKEAARLVIELAKHREAQGQVINVCTGLGVSLLDLTERLMACADFPVELRCNSNLTGNSKVNRLVGNPAKLYKLGMAPALPVFDTLLADILACARGEWGRHFEP